MDKYTPIANLLRNLSKTLLKPPIVLLISGSFNPVHIKHFQILKTATQAIKEDYEVIACYISPFSQKHVDKTYQQGAIPLQQRIDMIKIAIKEFSEESSNESSSWIDMIDISEWDANLEDDIDCHLLIKTFSEFLNNNNQIKPLLSEKNLNKLEIAYICGSDLITKDKKEQIKNLQDLEDIKIIICERYLEEKDKDWEGQCKELGKLYTEKWIENNIILIKQDTENTSNQDKNNIKISSTKIINSLIKNENNWEEMTFLGVTKYIKDKNILKS
ncbi:40518_t:CDS:1 [Gigaspora margarita]|uniref:40518_t:CDS:1 n=1 Tax=Gigaspora margarita TaxID=4874 RepID=A0ABN7UM55_GIGMA|nr:40518_t:CDS:1 [Gigaspora margarita]